MSGLRTALAMGAAKAILVSDDALKGAGALDTAKVLAAAIKRAEYADLVLAATESTDGYTGTVPGADRRAPRPAVGHVRQARSRSTDGTVKVQRQTEAGYDEVECPLPAVVSVTAGVVEPRYPSLQGDHGGQVQAGRRAHGRRPRPRRRQVGWAGAGQEIVDVEAAARARRPARSSKTTARASRRSSRFLENLKVI